MKLQIKIIAMGIMGLLMNCCITYPMELQNANIETSDGQHIEIPLNNLINCQALTYSIELEKNKVSNNTPISLVTPGLSKSDWLILQQTLESQKTKKENKKKLFITLQGSDYLGNEEVYKQSCIAWAKHNYHAKKKYSLPLHIDRDIAEKKIAQTPLLQDIPLWVGTQSPLPLVKELDCKKSLWTCGFNILGKIIASGNRKGKIYVWDTKTHELIKTLNAHNEAISMLQFDHSNNLWTTAQDGTIKCWNIEKNETIQTIQVSPEKPFTFCLSPIDSSLLAYENNNNTISILNNKTAIHTNLVGHENSIFAIDMDPRANLITSAGADSMMHVWDIESASQKELYNTTLDTTIYHVRFNDQSNRVAIGLNTGDIELVDLRSKQTCSILEGHTDTVWASHFYQDNYLISSSEDTTVRIWDLRKQVCLKNLKAHPKGIQYASLYGNILATASQSGTIKLWDLAPFIGMIQQTQKQFSKDLTLAQAQLISKAYEATPQEPLNCKDNKKRAAAVFGTFSENQQELLLQNLPITRSDRKNVKRSKK